MVLRAVGVVIGRGHAASRCSSAPQLFADGERYPMAPNNAQSLSEVAPTLASPG